MDDNRVKRRSFNSRILHLPENPDDQAYLIGSRCSLCGYTVLSKREVCPLCFKKNCMDEVQFCGRGKILSFAIVETPAQDLPAPYLQANIQLEEGPLLTSIIVGCEIKEDAMEIGQEVEFIPVSIFKEPDGTEVVGWRFRPIR